MTGFGDIVDADEHDDAPPDPEAVARILWSYLREQAPRSFRDFDAHNTRQRAAIVAAVRQLLDRLHREGPT